jgi:SH3-like domain-containing protein
MTKQWSEVLFRRAGVTELKRARIIAWSLVLSAGSLAVATSAVSQDANAQNKMEPRFASLKASEVNLRKGPGLDYPIAWVFRRAGLPVKIVREFEAWREITDAEGTTGWVLRTLISGRRTAQVLPWELKKGEPRPQEPLSEWPGQGGRAIAPVEAGVIADIHTCDGNWCNVSVGDFKGYISQRKLWGVAKGEVLE